MPDLTHPFRFVRIFPWPDLTHLSLGVQILLLADFWKLAFH